MFYIGLETSRGVDEEKAGRPSSFSVRSLLSMQPTSNRSFASISIKDTRETANPLCVSLNGGAEEEGSNPLPANSRKSLFDSAERVNHLSVSGFENADSGLSGLDVGSTKFIDNDFGVAGGASISAKTTTTAGGAVSSEKATSGAGSSGKAKGGAIKGTLKRGAKSDTEVLEF